MCRARHIGGRGIELLFSLQRGPCQTDKVRAQARIRADRGSRLRPANLHLEGFGGPNAQRRATDGEAVQIRNVTDAVVNLRHRVRGAEAFGRNTRRDASERNLQVHAVTRVREDERARSVNRDEIRVGRARVDFEQEAEHREFQRIRQLAGLLEIRFGFVLGHAAVGSRLAELALEENQLGGGAGRRNHFRIVQRLLQRTQHGAGERRADGIRVVLREPRGLDRIHLYFSPSD